MNAKKIMGAVLVALLAAALFVGAGAAADAAKAGIPTVFVYQKDTGYTGTWVSEDGKYEVTFNAKQAITGDDVVPGIYKNGLGADAKAIYVAYPTAAILTSVPGVIGGTIAPGTDVKFTAAATGVGNPDVIFTHPDGYLVNKFDKDVSGDWEVQAYFEKLSDKFDNITTQYLYGKAYAFTVASSDVTLTANKDSVVQGNVVIVTVTGKPEVIYYLKTTGVEVDAVNGQPALVEENDGGYIKIVTGSNGKASLALTTIGKGDLTVEVYEDKENENADAEVTLTVLKGILTAEAEAESYYIGNDIKISGTNSVGGTLLFFMAGTNIDIFQVEVTDSKKDGESWSATIKGSEYGNLDAGTYTIYVATAFDVDDVEDLEAAIKETTYTTVAVALKQPFITITSAPEVVVKGVEAEIEGTAEATKTIAYYVFGTNKFLAATNDAESQFTVVDTENIVVKNGKYTITLTEDVTETLAPGQYFIVIQHPMYDKFFNIWADNTNITTAETKNGALQLPGKVLFDVEDRQKANAAQALCDALDTQNIDDMYVKASFIVAAGTSSINPIPESVVKGTKLTVSGKTNGGEGTLVTVEMMSTAFAAVPKETVGSASFISLITKTDEDGNWEVTFDTSGLNVDEYTVTAAVDQFGVTTAKVNVVEKAPVTPEQPDTPDVPDVPEQPTEPEAPATPGFGALAALAGLGAVAVLLLRRE